MVAVLNAFRHYLNVMKCNYEKMAHGGIDDSAGIQSSPPSRGGHFNSYCLNNNNNNNNMGMVYTGSTSSSSNTAAAATSSTSSLLIFIISQQSNANEQQLDRNDFTQTREQGLKLKPKMLLDGRDI